MRSGFTVFSAKRDAAPALSASPAAAEALMNCRRVVFFILANRNASLWFRSMNNMTRREATKLIGTATAGVLLPNAAARGQGANETSTMLTRAIPASGEKLPVIGLGTYNVFDMDLTPGTERSLADVLSLFFNLGGRVVDSSPMYGKAEQVIGTLASKLR